MSDFNEESTDFLNLIPAVCICRLVCTGRQMYVTVHWVAVPRGVPGRMHGNPVNSNGFVAFGKFLFTHKKDGGIIKNKNMGGSLDVRQKSS